MTQQRRSRGVGYDVTSKREAQHLFLIPGMFGFSTLAGYDYFAHVKRALSERFAAAEVPCNIVVVDAPPTGSIRRRARVLADALEQACAQTTGPIHLVGHSTGGLDARLLASPSVDLGLSPDSFATRDRVRTVVTINTPHHGTPLAHFFSTVSGTRLLYALSLLTFSTLHFGGPPLAILSSLVAVVGRLDGSFGLDIRLLDRATDMLLRILGEVGRREVRDWLDGIRKDQGGVIQITPESMDIFNAAAEDSPTIRYGCIATSAPATGAIRYAIKGRWPRAALSAALSAALFTTLYAIASRTSTTYPPPELSEDVAARLKQGIGHELRNGQSDGIVPTRSMIWGDLLWSGAGDHLDVIGHFHYRPEPSHTDWLTSGAGFSIDDFEAAMDALAKHLLEGA